MGAFLFFNAIYFRYSTSVLAHFLSHNKDSLFCLILFVGRLSPLSDATPSHADEWEKFFRLFTPKERRNSPTICSINQKNAFHLQNHKKYSHDDLKMQLILQQTTKMHCKILIFE